MLIGKNAHGVIKNDNVVNAALLGAFSFIMYNAGFGVVVVFVACLCYTVRHIYILTIHKKGLIKQARLIECCLAKQHKCTRKHIHLVYLVNGQVGEVVFSKSF